jgi:hypothetical protein
VPVSVGQTSAPRSLAESSIRSENSQFEKHMRSTMTSPVLSGRSAAPSSGSMCSTEAARRAGGAHSPPSLAPHAPAKKRRNPPGVSLAQFPQRDIVLNQTDF